jgi:ribonucleoside-diphosphate reductase alpha subunit
MAEDTVKKRDGKFENISFDKIGTRLKKLGKGELDVNFTSLVQKVIDRLYDKIPTYEIDELTAQQCASLSTTHPDYGILASRIMISNHQKNTPSTLKECMSLLYNFRDVNEKHCPIVNNNLWLIMCNYHEEIEKMIDYNRDYLFDYFGFKTLERAYLMRVNSKIVERPQHMIMRVALALHGSDLDSVKESYELMSQKFFTHATPTLFNAGTNRQQMSSCYLIGMESDSIGGIYNTLSDCASISKWAGGIGMHIHNIRAAGSHIRGTNGTSNGIVPMLRVFNNTARYCDQGGGKRKGSFAIYLEPWHGDIESFLDMKKNHGDEEQRARDLFYALWIPDLFMKRVKSNSEWTLMCPDKCPGLSDIYGDEFESLYEKYESEGKGNKTVKARDIWLKILDSQIETGTPYMLYKDAVNKKSNQKNLGTIKSSNLCCEIQEYSDDKETAVCNLASIGLSKFINPLHHSYKSAKVWTKNDCGYCEMAKRLLEDNNITYQEMDVEKHKEEFEIYKKQIFDVHETEIKTVPQIELDGNYIGDYSTLEDLLRPEFDYKKLHEVTKIVTNNLNKVIDINFYPTEKTQRSNFKHRPVGIGVQGLADTFALMNIPFHSDKAKEINVKIFETIYHAALEKSCEISKNRIQDMIKIKISFEKNEWYFKNKDDYCTYYNINYPYDGYSVNEYDKIQELLEKYKPIPAEIKRDTHLGAYSSFIGSPTHQGILQFDMWDVTPSDRYDWSTLKENIKTYGIRNSLLLAPMPTASTSQILGNNECFEPFTSNIYVRRTLAGEFVIINKYLLKELIKLNLWNPETKNSIIKNRGSIQHMKNIPKVLRDRFKIVWEIPMKHVIEMSADRGAYICQSQSLNLWMENPNYNKLTAMHFFGWSKGLKTGEYYLRTKAKAAPQQFTIEPDKNQEDDEECLMCGA